MTEAHPTAEPSTPPVVGIVMGSDSDLPVMLHASETLDRFGIPHETRVVSAHRTPTHMADYAAEASGRGLKAIIAGAGGSAHLPGMVASETHVPVLGVAVGSDPSAAIGSQIQMPRGKPLAFMGSGAAGATNAALFVVRILALGDPVLAAAYERFDHDLAAEVLFKDDRLRSLGPRRYLEAPTPSKE